MKQLFANNAKTTLVNSVTETSTALFVSDGSKFPTPGANEYFLVTLELSGNVEVMMCTGRIGNTLTIGGKIVGGAVAGRNQEGTGARNFAAGTRVECRVTKETLDRMSKALAPMNDILDTAAPFLSYNDGYVINALDPFGNPIVTVARDANTWRFLNFTFRVGGTSSGAGTTVSLTCPTVSLSDVNVLGKYIIQFTSGVNIGKIRQVSSVVGNVITWSGAVTAVADGTTFEIFKSNASMLSDGLANLTFPISDNSGTADAILASYFGVANALTDNLTVLVVLSATNVTSTPTFSPNGQPAKVIRNNDGSSLDVGQLKGTIILRYESSTDDWRLLGSQQVSIVQPINYFLGNF